MSKATGTTETADFLLGVRAIAQYLGVSWRQAQHMVDTKNMPSFKVGGHVCARRSSIDAWIEALDKIGRPALDKARSPDLDKAGRLNRTGRIE